MLGEVIRVKRKEKGLTLKELGLLIDMTRRNISYIENEKYIRISWDIFNKFRAVLDIDNQEFIENYVNTFRDIDILIKSKREDKNLSREDLSRLSGVSVETIRNIEYGNTSTNKYILLKIAKVLDIENEINHCYLFNTENTSLEEDIFNTIIIKIKSLNNTSKLEVLSLFLEILTNSNDMDKIRQKLFELK